MKQIYLDHNATTPLHPAVAEVMRDSYGAGFANPSSRHTLGRIARRTLEEAREAIISILDGTGGEQENRLIFTSGGTEANNLAIKGLAEALGPGRIIISAVEHPSVLEAAKDLAQRGWSLGLLEVDSQGVVDPRRLSNLLTSDTRLVSVTAANHETGVIQPIQRITEICGKAGVPVHCDASQAIGKVPLDFCRLGVSAMTVSPHKFYGPVGIGALLIRSDVLLRPQLHGGFQQQGDRPGTESLPLILGMKKALELWREEQETRPAALTALRDLLEGELLAAWPEIVINGGEVERVPQTSNISFPGLDRQGMMMALDLAGVACSTGSACASGSSVPSPTLLAMGCEKRLLDGALRFSVGVQTGEEEVREAACRITKLCKELRQKNRAGKSASQARGSA